MTRPASEMSARSLRKALNRGSGGSDGPARVNCSALMCVGWRLADDWPVTRGAAFALAEVALKSFKKFGPAVGSDDEDISAVVLVPLPPQIAEASKRVQGARDDRL